MKLKKIEVQGFKSFADKINIRFKDGITAIVGPNGSGKSNISDAIRWVLGEQSVKTLRGSRMQDIIFAGTSKRKPVGYTEVSISFDNKAGKIPLDYEEVEITRRMFRSGESEYYLNKNSCRLRDIRELFMDTGVGKDGYSIIGQGRIEEILSNRPEDRRSIFEEAAGIVKYKNKKEEAEKRLSKTDSNLIRIKDIVSELSSRHDSLEKQAKKANTYISLFEKLKNIEVNIYVNNIKETESGIDGINREISKIEENLKSNILNKEKIDEKFNVIKINTNKLDLEIEKNREKERNTLNEIEKNKNNIIILDEKKSFSLRDLERVEKEKEALFVRADKIRKTKLENKEDLLVSEKTYDNLSLKYDEKSKELKEKLEKTKAIEKELELEKDNIIKTYNNLSDERSKLNSIIAFNENIEKRTIQLNKEISRIENEKIIKLKKHEEFKNGAIKLKDEMISLEKNFQKFKAMEKNSIKKKEILNEKINSNNVELQGKTSNLNLFKNMEKSYEGYYRGVKSVLRESENNQAIKDGLVGVVAELLKVDEKFEKAIDVALGSNAQNIVTKTEEDAKNIIEYLKKNKLGRITCLPLNVIKGRTLNFTSQKREEFQILGLASELIEYNESHSEIFKSLLGRTVIVENMELGIRLANRYGHSHRIVTLDGEVLNLGGSMTGGSYASNSVSIINRKNRISKLKKEINDFKEVQKKTIKDKKSIAEDLKEIKKQVAYFEEEIKKKNYEIINMENNRKNQNLELLRFDESIDGFQKEIKTLNLEVNNYNFEKNKLEDSLIELEKKSKESKEKINTLSKALKEKESDKDKFNDMVVDMKIDLNKNENKIKNLKERMKGFIVELKTIDRDLKAKDDFIASSKVDLENTDRSRDKLNEVIKELEIVKNNNKIKLNESIKEKQELMESYYLEQKNLKSINEKIGFMEKNINTNQVKLAKLSVKLENHYKKLEEDYELSYDEAMKYRNDKVDIEEDKIKAKKIKKEIKKIGGVNLNSIEEYEEVKTRLDFILEQENDLTTAKKDLRKVILDMEAKMKKQFIESFNIINENFKEIFSILFDGGKAELILEDEENILTTGIEIKAQPPGKKLQNLSLLSGGEKSLTAVALLFSILKMKPAPFCVLDEIDAALDEANIGRYTNYLKNYCQETQFIIITHRKTTMEMADVLYGVTMEEEGISKLISVELKDDMEIIAS